ncbi:MAG TPA: DUF192 domain-containing protein [Nevskiaceae bacterium]|nr:DUF192 domain-containing protein [Nevskiaceae bacterium]
MPNSVIARIKSALKNPAVSVGAVALMLLGGVLVVFNEPSAKSLRVSGRTFKLEVAQTPQAQAKGLGGRSSLSANRGMLFVFGDEAPRCFWMKDTHFPLDIIWLNERKQVVSMETNVSPRTYPRSFCPEDAAQYVIELSAGQAIAAHIQDGQHLDF